MLHHLLRIRRAEAWIRNGVLVAIIGGMVSFDLVSLWEGGPKLTTGSLCAALGGTIALVSYLQLRRLKAQANEKGQEKSDAY